MFLTEDEFIILSAIKIGLNNTEIKEKFGIELIKNDSRLNASFQKYGVSKLNELLQFGSLKKVEVLQKKKSHITSMKVQNLSIKQNLQK